MFRNQRSVEIGFVVEHRFAFAYWINCKQNLIYNLRTRKMTPDKKFQPPDLVSWDWHDDSGADADCDPKELEQLDQRNESEVALYCWTSLPSNNDGQMLPAIWLNAIGNVYIVQKQRDEEECIDFSREYEDRYGRPHQIRYFRTHEEMAASFEETNTGNGVIWDLDMDFFVTEEGGGKDFAPLVSKRSISSMLSYKKPWMQLILQNLKAITIALEPSYTGGLSQSLELYQAWEKALFDSSTFSTDCHWKQDVFSD